MSEQTVLQPPIILHGFYLAIRRGLNHVAVAVGDQLPLQGGKLVTVIGCTNNGEVKTDEQGPLAASMLRLEWIRVAKPSSSDTKYRPGTNF